MSTITKEFTKEQLIEKLQHRISVASGFPESEKAQIDLEVARIALASLEAEPVGYVDADYAELLKSGEIESCSVYAEPGEGCITVFTAPPAPECLTRPVHPRISSEELDDETLDELIDFRRCTFEYHSQQDNKVKTIIHGVTLTAMLELRDRRAAMLHGADGNSPVIPDGWVLVPEEPTHEMLEAGDEQFGTYDVYRRMIAAAPQWKVK
ncbi:hypothetical protein V6269_02920 [Enterobacter roggenkampii]|uniref:hypothetical protein n=1 Tax=Enterobacter roggenkampii TaxID=1812935 RepID=UPI003B840934